MGLKLFCSVFGHNLYHHYLSPMSRISNEMFMFSTKILSILKIKEIVNGPELSAPILFLCTHPQPHQNWNYSYNWWSWTFVAYLVLFYGQGAPKLMTNPCTIFEYLSIITFLSQTPHACICHFGAPCCRVMEVTWMLLYWTLLVLTKAQLGFSMPLVLPILLSSPTVTVGLSSRPSSSLARFEICLNWNIDVHINVNHCQLIGVILFMFVELSHVLDQR